MPLVDRDESAVIPIELDVKDESADRQTAQRVIEILGRLDGVANAAGYDTEGAANDEQRELERVQTTLFGALWISRAALVYMRVNTGSRTIQVFGLESLENYRDRRPYDTTRRALAEFSKHRAREVAPLGVGVSICVTAELNEEWTDDNRVRTYTIDPYDPRASSSVPVLWRTNCAGDGLLEVSPRNLETDESSRPSPVAGFPDLTAPREDTEMRHRRCEKGDACTGKGDACTMRACPPKRPEECGAPEQRVTASTRASSSLSDRQDQPLSVTDAKAMVRQRSVTPAKSERSISSLP